jgi:hypothetical protein
VILRWVEDNVLTGRNERKTEKVVLPLNSENTESDTRPLSAVLHACAQAVDKKWNRDNGREERMVATTKILYDPDRPASSKIPRHKHTRYECQADRNVFCVVDGEDRDGDFRGNKRKSRKFEGRKTTMMWPPI